MRLLSFSALFFSASVLAGGALTIDGSGYATGVTDFYWGDSFAVPRWLVGLLPWRVRYSSCDLPRPSTLGVAAAVAYRSVRLGSTVRA